MSSSKNILILGASFAGLPVAHYLAKNLPADYTITLVNPSTHLYWNVASPRALVVPESLGKKHNELLFPFLPGFEKYPAGRFTFVQGKAVSSSPATNTVTVRTCSDEGKSEVRDINIEYAHLVIATGSRGLGGDWAFKATERGTHVDLRAALASGRDAIAAAQSIVISGAGATGCELVGEIASQFQGKGKHITFLSSGAGLLPMVREDVGKSVQSQLEKMGVEVRTNVKVTSETKRADGSSDLVLSTGETIAASVHIPTWGIAPNSSFLPKDLLDNEGWVVTDKYLKSPTYSNVWALGDITHWGNRKLTTIEAMYDVVIANLVAAINGKSEAEFKEYKHSSTLLLLVPLGPGFGKGTGFLFGWKVWGWVTWLLKGRTYLVESNRPIAEGKHSSGKKKF